MTNSKGSYDKLTLPLTFRGERKKERMSWTPSGMTYFSDPLVIHLSVPNPIMSPGSIEIRAKAQGLLENKQHNEFCGSGASQEQRFSQYMPKDEPLLARDGREHGSRGVRGVVRVFLMSATRFGPASENITRWEY